MSLLEGDRAAMNNIAGAPALDHPALFGLEDELVLVRISVDPRHLEELLEVLAALDFPVNPELYHRTGSVTVELPAYHSHIGQIQMALEQHGFDPQQLAVFSVLQGALTEG